jgi:type IV secretory pathway VirB2 component (pilin)
VAGSTQQPRIPAEPLAPVRYTGSMGKTAVLIAYVLVMIAVIVGLDVGFFRSQFWPRLMVNVGVVLVFGAFYLRFAGRT